MDEQEPVKLADGEDWLAGRTADCPACGVQEADAVQWDAEKGAVCCSWCGYQNPEATADVTRYLAGECDRLAGVEAANKEARSLLGDIARAINFTGDFLGDGPGLVETVKKMHEDLKKARAKPAKEKAG